MTPPPSPPREERPVVRQPAVDQVRLEIIGIGEEEEIVELEELGPEVQVAEAVEGNRVDLRPFTNAVLPV